jgi:replicative DNA helicase
MSLAEIHHLEPGDPRDEVASAPHNLDAEHALLGAILFDNEALFRAEGLVTAADFHEGFHGRLYAAMTELIGRGQLAEPIVLMERFRREQAFVDLGGMRFLADLIDRAPPAANAGDYARIVHDLALRRSLIRLSGEITVAANDGQKPAVQAIEQTEQQLYALAETGAASGGPKPFSDALRRTIDAAAAAYNRDGKLTGLSTGLIDLDKLLGGLHPSDLVILAARP